MLGFYDVVLGFYDVVLGFDDVVLCFDDVMRSRHDVMFRFADVVLCFDVVRPEMDVTQETTTTPRWREPRLELPKLQRSM